VRRDDQLPIPSSSHAASGFVLLVFITSHLTTTHKAKYSKTSQTIEKR
jgi:succinate dehydrogenase/fumarate reductase cytochrome b subunit